MISAIDDPRFLMLGTVNIVHLLMYLYNLQIAKRLPGLFSGPMDNKNIILPVRIDQSNDRHSTGNWNVLKLNFIQMDENKARPSLLK